MHHFVLPKSHDPIPRSYDNPLADLFLSVPSRSGKELEMIDRLFSPYAKGLSHEIDPEGIESLCNDLGMEPTDLRVLMLAWKMRAKKQGYFSLEEWRVGLGELRADTITKLKRALPRLEAEVRWPPNFKDFCAFAFSYSLTEENQKCVDIETICALCNLVLSHDYPAQVTSFTQYLKEQTDYRVITFDQWLGFSRFCRECTWPDLKDYDPDQPWPLLVDGFVDWVKEQQEEDEYE